MAAAAASISVNIGGIKHQPRSIGAKSINIKSASARSGENNSVMKAAAVARGITAWRGGGVNQKRMAAWQHQHVAYSSAASSMA